MPNIFTKRVLNRFSKLAPELAPRLEKVPMQLDPRMDGPFEMLVRSIVYQQLSGKAAKTIHDRLLALLKKLTPTSILSKSEDELRSVGLSRQKASYVKNVAEAFARGGPLYKYNKVESLSDLTSKEITDLLVDIKGVGVWTVQMYLIFSLGRLDVLASGDLGVRKGVKELYNLDEVPTEKQVNEIGKSWHPYETVGTYLAWRILESEEEDDWA
jgi:DNA-3-methyladenine glycosylase II